MAPVRYILVVHGIGDQRLNETAIHVINRFAEARSSQRWPPPRDVLSLGMATGQTGWLDDERFEEMLEKAEPWLEFHNIPSTADPVSKPFLGLPSDAKGHNLRFVDIHWSTLLQRDFPHVGERTERWANNLLGRLLRKDEHAVRSKHDAERVPGWILDLLRILRSTVILVRRFLSMRRWQSIDKMIFDDYLGDVQLYGEYARSRGQAVRRFHKIIDRIEAKHADDEPPRYTVIAHSLGTVLSFDALLYARSRLEHRRASDGAAKLPFPGYLSEDEEKLLGQLLETGLSKDPPARRKALAAEGLAFLDTAWSERVDSWVTLGSPIDKFLILWWLNFRHLNRSDWLEEVPGDGRIQHFNYSDEQDPVGHHLQTAEATAAYRRVFFKAEDRVYNRSAIPGAAHTNYWYDNDLFRWILARAVDEVDDPGDEPQWFHLGIYRKVMFISYLMVPAAVTLIDYFAFTWAWYSTSWHSRALATVLTILIFILGRYLIDLTVWWRQILRFKASLDKPRSPGDEGSAPDTAPDEDADGDEPSQGSSWSGLLRRWRQEEERPRGRSIKNLWRRRQQEREEAAYERSRRRWEEAFQLLGLAVVIFLWVAAALTSGLYLAEWDRVWPWGKVTFIAVLSGLALLFWLRVLRSKDVAWEADLAMSLDMGEADTSRSFSAADGWGRRIAGWLRRLWRQVAEFAKVDLAIWLLLGISTIGGWQLVEAWVAEHYPVLTPLAAYREIAQPALDWLRLEEVTDRMHDVEIRPQDVFFAVASFFVVAAIVFTYLTLRVNAVRQRLARTGRMAVDFARYAPVEEDDSASGGPDGGGDDDGEPDGGGDDDGEPDGGGDDDGEPDGGGAAGGSEGRPTDAADPAP